MPRDLEALMAKALAKARVAGSIPTLVLPFTFRDALPFDPGTGGWPHELHMPDGMGMVAVRFGDDIGEPANDSTR
jgi:hypothetical protein